VKLLLTVFEVDEQNDLLLQSGLTDDEASALLRYMTQEHAATAVKAYLRESDEPTEATNKKKRGNQPLYSTPLKAQKRDGKRATPTQAWHGMTAASLQVQRRMNSKQPSELYRLHVREDEAEVKRCASQYHTKQVPQLKGLCVFVEGLVQPKFTEPATWSTFWFCPTAQCLKASVKKPKTSLVPLFSQTAGVTLPANLALTEAQQKAVKSVETEEKITVTVRE
jgi:hypothetical protein